MLEKEVESIVLAMWEDSEEEMALEVVNRFDLTFDLALELVEQAIKDEVFRDNEYEVAEAQEWYDFDPDC